MKLVKITALVLISLFIFTRCTKESDPPETGDNTELPQEVISKVVLSFINVNDSNDICTASYSEINGLVTVTPIDLKSDATYYLNISLYDHTNSADVVDKTPVIIEESIAHQFFFQPQNGAENLISVSYDDFDPNGNPVGLQTTWTIITGIADDEESVKITLKHQPEKTASGVGINDPELAGGLIDWTGEFPVTIHP